MTQVMAALNLIDANPWQPRTTDDPEHINNLALSIAQDGLLQPPAARKKNDRYELVFGHSRFKAICFLHAKVDTEPDWFAANNIFTSNDYESIPLEIIDLDDEGMYRQAISENMQRRDLNAIEEAQAMQRAIKDFSYTSAQVGELFGRSDSTVRGMIRLLDLPDEARQMLGHGEISQNSARALLSMQKIAPAARVIETARKIQNNDSQFTPEQVIEQAMRSQRDVTTMWEDNFNGQLQPRGNYLKHSWLLSMTNFPNKFLPQMTLEEIFTVLNITNLDSRQAHFVRNYKNQLLVLSEMMQTSDYEVDHPLGNKLKFLIDPPACTACPMYTRINGKHLCGMRICNERKTIAWKKEIIRAAGADLKILPYENMDGPFKALDGYAEKEFFESRHPDMRLIESSMVRGYPVQYNFDGVNRDVFYVVVVGEKLRQIKEAEKIERALEKSGQKPIKQRWELVSLKREQFRWMAAQYFQKLFESWTPGAVQALFAQAYGWHEHAAEWASPAKDADAVTKEFYLRRVLALNIMCAGEDLANINSVTDLATMCLEAARKCLLVLPEKLLMEMAAAADAEIEAQFPRVPVAVDAAV